MANKRFVKRNIRDEADLRSYNAWNQNMNNVYGMLQHQQVVEKIAESESVGMPQPEKKKKKGFFSKLGDALSSNLYQASKSNTKSMKK